MATDRLLTHAEEWAIRLTHPDFQDLTVQEAAKRMGLSVRRVEQLLASVRKKAPQLFARETIRPRGAMLGYSPDMDGKIVRKF